MPLAKHNYEPDEDGAPKLVTEGEPRQNPNPDAPMTEEAMTLYLIDKLSSNYKTKFKTHNAPEMNVFSVSTLTAGPGTALSYRIRNAREASGEEPLVFNASMYRGSAIHKYTEEKLPDWFPYESLVDKHKCPNCGFNHAIPGSERPIYVREVFEYKWKEGTLDSKGQPLKDLVIYGHPDFVKDNMILELKTVESKMGCTNEGKCELCKAGTLCEGAKKRKNYLDNVVKKAKFQVGCYTRMLQKELKRRMFGYVVIIDKGLRVHLLSEDELWHGYNFVRWCVYECAKRMENPLEDLAKTKTPPIATAEKGHLGNASIDVRIQEAVEKE
jgi:hypothetical protein